MRLKQPLPVRQFVSPPSHQTSIAMEKAESRKSENLKAAYEFTAWISGSMKPDARLRGYARGGDGGFRQFSVFAQSVTDITGSG